MLIRGGSSSAPTGVEWGRHSRGVNGVWGLSGRLSWSWIEKELDSNRGLQPPNPLDPPLLMHQTFKNQPFKNIQTFKRIIQKQSINSQSVSQSENIKRMTLNLQYSGWNPHDWPLWLSSSAPSLGDQRLWYVQQCFCDWVNKDSLPVMLKSKV